MTQTTDFTDDERQAIANHFGFIRGRTRELMEAVKTHCGWSETSAAIADDTEMYSALKQCMDHQLPTDKDPLGGPDK